jgi:hypothetical protein
MIGALVNEVPFVLSRSLFLRVAGCRWLEWDFVVLEQCWHSHHDDVGEVLIRCHHPLIL